jgi:hypothetical protein
VQRANVAIFLTAIALIGLAPLILAVASVARRRADGGGGGRRGRRRIVVAGITSLLVVGGTVAAAWALAGRAEPGAGSASGMGGMGEGGTGGMSTHVRVPRTLAGLELTALTRGDDAIAEVTALHGAPFPLVDAAVARYGDAVGVWVSSAPDVTTAQREVDEMRARIAEGGTPFATPTLVRTAGRVFTTSGMGERHFFFSSGRDVWWISAPPPFAKEALDDLMRGAAA